LRAGDVALRPNETAGDPTLNRDAWLEVVNLNEQWNEFVDARGALFKDITARSLPTPE